MSISGHIPVMVNAVMSALLPRCGGVYVDATFGAGGYSARLLESVDCVVIAIDRDPSAVAGGRSLSDLHSGLSVVEGSFSDLLGLVSGAGYDKVSGICFDVGVSSMQLDTASRGFSFRHSGPLDMRMSQRGVSASDIVNDYDETLLARIIAVYGEERRSRSIARSIVRARSRGRLTRTDELAEIVRMVVGGGYTPHPATRVFQALRVYINDELGELIAGLHAAEQILDDGGCLAVVSFHSLEDRIVKRFLASRSGRVSRGSRHLPEVSEVRPSFSGMRSVVPCASEVATNPRSRSARLRFAYRNDAPSLPPMSAHELMPAHTAMLHEEHRPSFFEGRA